MITVKNLYKFYKTRSGPKKILDNININVESSDKIGILGRNGSGKSTLIRLISGAENPSAGSITRSMSVSWPLAFGGGFQGSLTGFDNLKFICRVYNAKFEEAKIYVENFSELGKYLNEPVKNYSAGMRARLAFGISMAIDFDCLLVDEVIAVGDKWFRERCEYEIFEKRANKAIVMVSHDAGYIREHCNKYFVLTKGVLKNFQTADEAYNFYESK